MTNTPEVIAKARVALGIAEAALNESERRIAELEAAAVQSAEAALAVVGRQSAEPAVSFSDETAKPKPERKPRQRQRQPRGQALQKVREAFAVPGAGPQTASDLAKETGLDVAAIYRHIRKLEGEGAIIEVEADGAGKHYQAVRQPDILVSDASVTIPEGNGAGDETQVPVPA